MNNQAYVYKRTLIVVVIAQLFGGAGLAAGLTVGALLAQSMVQGEALAGLPVALITLGSALAAFLIGRMSQRLGRRVGLSLGFLAGFVGAIGILVAAVLHSIWLLWMMLFLYGAGTASNLQARYAGTDLATDKQRATAVSIALVSTTFGAVLGPNLVDVMGDFAASLGIPPLAGPFILAALAYGLAGLTLFIFLRPDPFLLAQSLLDSKEQQNEVNEAKPMQKGVVVGAMVMILTQIIMVAIMTMTPVHMEHHGHSLREIGLVISIHVGAMYLPSLFTGILIDRLGRTVMVVSSAITLLGAGLLAAFTPPDSLFGLIVALGLLGLGWNLGLISGTALLVDGTHPSVRAKVQGSVDVFVALAGASGGAMSGMVASGMSFSWLSLLGGFLALSLVPIVFWAKHSREVEEG
ncbi:MFS transporter [Geomicrobium sp. JCM 19055]|uniref:MFS transporter n=1 Tax=Geomicrobium sp. JCM 19055 TaxID=1460649 RepID=UPI00045ED7B9|nr:MFS transporter [Geomicrobium sp. JCM 19055]GAJ97966.1 tetracycline resistance protein [Geomicrobium sp. JCM 19055]